MHIKGWHFKCERAQKGKDKQTWNDERKKKCEKSKKGSSGNIRTNKTDSISHEVNPIFHFIEVYLGAIVCVCVCAKCFRTNILI